VWDLAIDRRPVAELRRLAQWLAGYRLDARALPVTPGSMEAAREGQWLREGSPAEFAASPRQIFAWHEVEAAQAERSQRWAAALPLLDALIAAQPSWRTLHARRGRAHAQLGHWNMAAADFAQASREEPEEIGPRSALALVRLAQGDTAGYRRDCAALFLRFGGSARFSDAGVVVRTSVAAPDALSDPARLAALAARLVNRYPQLSGSGGMLGGALYRAGQFGSAVQRLTAVDENSGTADRTMALLFLAMSHARLGHAQEARQWLAKASEQNVGNPALRWDQRLILQHLRQEAESLVAGTR
jgi:tetratricopeptide (TPR) repeat protein